MKRILAILAVALLISSASSQILIFNGHPFRTGSGPYLLGASNSAMNLPLAHSSTPLFTFLGSFKLPANITFGGGAVSTAAGHIYLMANVFYNAGKNSSYGVAEATLPTLTGTPAMDGSNGPAPCNTAPCGSGGSGTVVTPRFQADANGVPSWPWGANYSGGIGTSSSSTISGATLTVGGILSPSNPGINVLTMVTGVGIPLGTYVTARGTGTGGAGTYTIANFNGASIPTIAVGQLVHFYSSAITPTWSFANATAVTISGNVMTVAGTYTGPSNIFLTTSATGINIPFGTYITAFGTGAGGAGTYTLANAYGATIPNISSPEQVWFNNGGGGAGARPAGTLAYGGNFYATGGVYFDTSSTTTGWLIRANSAIDNSSWGAINSSNSVHGLATCGPNSAFGGTGTYTRFFSGSLGIVPAIWVPFFGGPLYTTSGQGAQQGWSISTASPAGFDLATFDPSTYNSSGGSISMNQILQYCSEGISTNPGPHGYSLAYRKFTGPFPVGVPGGGYTTFTASGASIPNGTTSFTLTAGFVQPYGVETAGISGYPNTVQFSDGETRQVHLTFGNAKVPDGAYAGYTTFAPLTGCGGGCSTTVIIRPNGDAFESFYDGPYGTGFWIPGSRTFAVMEIHGTGPLHARNVGCTPNSSSNNNFPIPPDTAASQQLEVYAYDSRDLYAAQNGTGGANVWTPSPYENWDFPSWQSFATGGCLSALQGFVYFDPATNILYAIFTNNESVGGQLIVNEWSVAPVTAITAPRLYIQHTAANDDSYSEAA